MASCHASVNGKNQVSPKVLSADRMPRNLPELGSERGSRVIELSLVLPYKSRPSQSWPSVKVVRWLVAPLFQNKAATRCDAPLNTITIAARAIVPHTW
jgi:hypothetical protein